MLSAEAAPTHEFFDKPVEPVVTPTIKSEGTYEEYKMRKSMAIETAHALNPLTLANNAAEFRDICPSQLYGRARRMLESPTGVLIDRFAGDIGMEAAQALADNQAILAAPRRPLYGEVIEDKVGNFKGPSMDFILPPSKEEGPDSSRIVFVKMGSNPQGRWITVNYMFLKDYLQLPDFKLGGMVRSIDVDKGYQAYSSRKAVSTPEVAAENMVESRHFLANMVDFISKVDRSTRVILPFSRTIKGSDGQVDHYRTKKLYDRYEAYFANQGCTNVVIVRPNASNA